MIDNFFDEITLGIGAILMVLGLVMFRRTRNFIARCCTAEGRVIGYTREESDDGVSYYSRALFRDRSDVEHELRGSRGLQNPPKAGKLVSITYDPMDPKNAWVTGSAAPWVIPWFVLIVGVALVIGGFVIRTESS